MRNTGGWIRRALIALAAGVLVLLGAAPASADVDDFDFASLDVVYELSRDDEGAGVVTVTETFVAEFPSADQNRGMRRAIPDAYLGAPLHPTLIRVTDENGDPRPVETETEDGYYYVTSRADDYLHGRQTFVFTYTLENVGRTMDNGVDEFYWDVNGEEWPQSFGTVTAEVHVDPELAAEMTGDAACYSGSTGSDAQCDARVNGADVGAGPVSLGPYQVMTVAVGFEPGTFAEFDSSPFASGWAIAQIGTALLALGAVVWSIAVRVRHLRDAPGRPTIIPEYAPPAGMDAMRASVLLKRSTKAVPAEILEQAVGGSLRILENEKGLFGSKKMEAQLLDPRLADANGREILEGLFPGLVAGDVFTFGKSNSQFAKRAQAAISLAKKNTKHLRRKVSPALIAPPVVAAVVFGGATFLFGVIAGVNYVSPALPVALCFVGVVAFFASLFLVSRDPLTEAGAEARDHLRGLEMFMAWAEADRIRMLQSPEGAERSAIDANDPAQVLHLYERLLPYAVIFGMEKKWSEELAVRYGDGSPGWYAGSGAFSAAAFSSGMSSLSSSASSSSSTSGGSSGGGSAGGGGGGGGGGGV
ncbi:DUF2207 domain-containing protein [Microbacterium sp. G2-8]|uniref:DUF2207 domain-containing protein n=1 Tax=Microbacterium sp. G2-8 TaxID=2842454 RepID=UPI001C89C597|nr:DUF2207 domain-containing protein [Microbacterium sp. G2-8]